MSKKRASSTKLYTFEHKLALDLLPNRLDAGPIRLAGTDEAGAGPLAGPVVAAAAMLPPEPIEGLNDSKQLTEKMREALYEEIRAKALAFCIVEISPEEIDKLNIYWACVKAMTLAVRGLAVTPEVVVVDARRLPEISIPQAAVVKGDAKCASIAAASILAKVYRDHLMQALDAHYPGYGFAKHKGYGTEEHLQALAKLGPTPAHRLTFAPVSNKQLQLGL